MFNTIELWDVPAQLLHSKTEFRCEMSEHDHSFLCGLIKYRKPKKLVEIGVAEGGTTAVIMNTLSLLDLNCEVWSVDLSDTLYCDNTKRTGYEYERLKPYIDGKNIKHQILLGKTIAGQIDVIGNNIDFAIIDTTHCLPGEILDFLCIRPYLTENAMVVLHDVNLNYVRTIKGTYSQMMHSGASVATKLLFSAITADKYMTMDQGKLPNIAAFTISKDTYKYINDLFYLLTLSWAYIPTDAVLNEYRNVLDKNYDTFSMELYDIALSNNREMEERREKKEDIRKNRFPYNMVPIGSRIVLYGAGMVGREIYEVQKEKGLYEIVAWVDKKYEEYNSRGGKKEVESPEMLLKLDYDYIIVAVEERRIFDAIQKEILINKWNTGKAIIGPMSEF